jgi:hypothetical protein|tara:strand:+ start:90 stop:302 length:213 start_codon:yes stop_codon:yes gene_type:complete
MSAIIRGVGIALRGFGKALKKDPTEPIKIKPLSKIGDEEKLKKLKARQKIKKKSIEYFGKDTGAMYEEPK